MNSRDPRPRGLTLIELLAVIVIVSMTTAAVTVSLGAADSQAQFMRVAAGCQDLDARGRILAQTQGDRCTLRVLDEPHRLVLTLPSSEPPMVELQVLAGFRLHMLSEDRPVETVAFDRNGRSPDYRVVLQHDGIVNIWRVSGLTGHITREVSP